MIRMVCWVRNVDRVSTDVLQDRVGVVVKIEDMIIQSLLQLYDHVMHGDIKSQICEVMEVEITEKRKKGQPRKSWEECKKKIWHKKRYKTIWLEKRGCARLKEMKGAN